MEAVRPFKKLSLWDHWLYTVKKYRFRLSSGELITLIKIGIKLKNIIKIVAVLIAYIVLVLGVMAMATPLPGATLILATGLMLVTFFSPRGKRGLRFLRARWPQLDRAVSWIETNIGNRIKFIGIILSETRPAAKE